MLDDFSKARNYYKTDLLNIEEILSILEMGKKVEGKKINYLIKRYIRDVIKACTTEFHPSKKLSGNWNEYIFGEDIRHQNIIYESPSLRQ